ncbi:MAG: hypothetical protein NTX24_05425 [Candidatus Pacearchaeota archaeon]|nr:hypothetical protein [Candidatus Pacearchaeota archaeon]
MAKKKKRFNAKSKSRVDRESVVKPMSSIKNPEKRVVDSFYPTAYTLNIVASVIVLIASILFVIFPEQVGGFSALPTSSFVSLLGVLDMVIGLAMLISSAFMRIDLRQASVFVLAFSVLALLFTPHGFVMGPLIGIVTSLVVLAKLR